MARGSLQLEAKATVKLGSFRGCASLDLSLNLPRPLATLLRFAAVRLCGDAQSWGVSLERVWRAGPVS
jgi:hypothetical protein